MNKPPKEIDGARVVEWAWSGEEPFGSLKNENGELASEIFGFAICQYDESSAFYRFSCDKTWESQQDSEYPSVEDAKQNLPQQYKHVSPDWIIYE